MDINNQQNNNILTCDNLADNSTINLKVDQTIDIVLKGNPTTGFTWILKNAQDLNKSVLNPLNLSEENSSNTYKSSNIRPGYTGVGGNYHFHFNGVTEGKVNLEFVYKRSWEDSISDNIIYNVEVSSK